MSPFYITVSRHPRSLLVSKTKLSDTDATRAAKKGAKGPKKLEIATTRNFTKNLTELYVHLRK